MKTTLAAAAAILTLSVAPAFAQSASGPASAPSGASTSVGSDTTPSVTSGSPSGGASVTPSASATDQNNSLGTTGPESTTGAPAGDLAGAGGQSRAYPACMTPRQDSCRVTRRTPANAR